jgi:glycosyltransferase involved in cell wall biosynthesis
MYRPRALHVTPIGMPAGERGSDGYFPSRANLLFLGKMDWPPNRDGLKWFLDEVWPEARAARADLGLTIAGAGQADWLKPYLAHPGVTFLGRVPALDPVYREAAACLVPIFYGSGTRVKAIEAGTYARACLGTALGVEGIGYSEGESYLRAESREDWLRQLRELDLPRARAVGQAARARVIEGFDPARVAGRLLARLREI